VKRRWSPAALVLLALMLLPAIAFAGDGDSSKFEAYINQHGMFVAIAACFGFGFIASLTPCVFPMVPITVSIFGAGTGATSKGRGAALSATFVLGIASLFTPLGVASAMSGKLMGSALSNTYVVIGLAVLFAALASSMFGAFEIALPASMQGKLSTVGGVGFKGAFVMGLVMGLIAAPCTGPFLTGIVTWIATTKDIALGSAAMFSFALGLGVLFFVAGTFAVALPKAGAWMMGIKWASGVGLAYMAFAYLRDGFKPVHDLVAHTSMTYGIAAALVFGVGLVLGIVHIMAERRKSPIAHLSKPMKLASIVPSIAGLVMLVSWMITPKVSGSCPKWMTDEAQARTVATSEGKPILIDFGASWCTACKELEEKTFPTAEFCSEAQRFVLLHVDASDDEDEATKQLSAKYKVVGLPTIIMLDKDGNEVVRFNEFLPPDQFVPKMKKVPSGSAVAGR
jgi:thioredoxin:protein disulfide reductase